MVVWIKRIAAILGISTFFVLLLLGIASSQAFTWESFVPACTRAIAGAALFWIFGIIIGDILLKGIVTDVEVDDKALIEGGLLQQVHAVKERILPEGAEQSLAPTTAIKKKENEKKK